MQLKLWLKENLLLKLIYYKIKRLKIDALKSLQHESQEFRVKEAQNK